MNEENCKKCGVCDNRTVRIPKVNNDQREWRKLIIIVLLLMAALVFNNWMKNQDFASEVNNLIPGAHNFAKISNDPLVYKASDNNNTVIAYCGVGEGKGYAGNIRIAVAVDCHGKVLGTRVLDQVETPAYFAKLIKSDYFKQYRGKKIDGDAFKLNQDVQAVSGATVSSRGSINAIIAAIKGIIAQQPDLAGNSEWSSRGEHESTTFRDYLPLLALCLLLSIAIYGSIRKKNRLRWVTMLAGIAILGIWQERMLSLAIIGNLFMNPLLFVKISLFTAVLIIAVALTCLLLRKNLYCYWICPFGATQEIIFKASGNKNPKIEKTFRTKTVKITKILAAAALLAGIALGNPGLTSFEPFSTLFGFSGGAHEWLLLALVLIGAFFVERFWCRFFCPVGIINNWMIKWGTRLKKSSLTSKTEKGVQDLHVD